MVLVIFCFSHQEGFIMKYFVTLLFGAMIGATCSFVLTDYAEQQKKPERALVTSSKELINEVNELRYCSYRLREILFHFGTHLEKDSELIKETLFVEVPSQAHSEVSFDVVIPFEKRAIHAIEHIAQENTTMLKSLQDLASQHPNIRNYAIFDADFRKIDKVRGNFEGRWGAYQQAVSDYNKKRGNAPEAFQFISYPR